MVRHWLFLVTLFIAAGMGSVCAQDSTAAGDSTRAVYDAAWTPIVERNGVRISFIFYSEADNVNNGVVIRLRNRNDYPVGYAFTVVFRGPSAEATARAEGELGAGEMKTGESAGLFWVPFEDGSSIGEVGLRGIEVTRMQREDSPPPFRD